MKNAPLNSLRRCAALASLALVLAAAPNAMAAATNSPPSHMSYQGFLTDATGTPLANADNPGPQNFDLIFRIYDAATGTGGLLWAEKQTVTVDKGYFSVLLGAGSANDPDPRPALPTIFTSSDRFLQITIKGAGSPDLVILPRIQLLPTAYSWLSTATKSIDAISGLQNRMNELPLFLSATPDLYTYLGRNSSLSNFNSMTLSGPRLIGQEGGILGSSSATGEKAVLVWNANGRVAINQTAASVELDVNGAVKATSFQGSGALLTALGADKITTGTLDANRLPTFDASKITGTATLADGVLSANVALRSGGNGRISIF